MNPVEGAGLADFAASLANSIQSAANATVIDSAFASLLHDGIEKHEPDLNAKVIERIIDCLDINCDEPAIVSVDVWEYQRKSVLLWRKPYLADDPAPFECEKGIISVEKLADYKLDGDYVWITDWNCHVNVNDKKHGNHHDDNHDNENKTDEMNNNNNKDNSSSPIPSTSLRSWFTDCEGWVYCDVLAKDLQRWNPVSVIKSHLLRKRLYNRKYIKIDVLNEIKLKFSVKAGPRTISRKKNNKNVTGNLIPRKSKKRKSKLRSKSPRIKLGKSKDKKGNGDSASASASASVNVTPVGTPRLIPSPRSSDNEASDLDSGMDHSDSDTDYEESEVVDQIYSIFDNIDNINKNEDEIQSEMKKLERQSFYTQEDCEHQTGRQYQLIINEIEKYDSHHQEWKPLKIHKRSGKTERFYDKNYENLYFYPNFDKHNPIESLNQIHMHFIRDINFNNEKDGIWHWCEEWGCVNPSNIIDNTYIEAGQYNYDESTPELSIQPQDDLLTIRNLDTLTARASQQGLGGSIGSVGSLYGIENSASLSPRGIYGIHGHDTLYSPMSTGRVTPNSVSAPNSNQPKGSTMEDMLESIGIDPTSMIRESATSDERKDNGVNSLNTIDESLSKTPSPGPTPAPTIVVQTSNELSETGGSDAGKKQGKLNKFYKKFKRKSQKQQHPPLSPTEQQNGGLSPASPRSPMSAANSSLTLTTPRVDKKTGKVIESQFNDKFGWLYCQKLSKDDSEWSNKIPSENSFKKYRRRVWVRCMIFENYCDFVIENYREKKKFKQLQKKNITKPKRKRSNSASNLNIGDVSVSKTQSVALKTPNNAPIGVDSGSGSKYSSGRRKTAIARNNEELRVGEFLMREVLNGVLWHIHLASQSNVVDKLSGGLDDEAIQSLIETAGDEQQSNLIKGFGSDDMVLSTPATKKNGIPTNIGGTHIHTNISMTRQGTKTQNQKQKEKENENKDEKDKENEKENENENEKKESANENEEKDDGKSKKNFNFLRKLGKRKGKRGLKGFTKADIKQFEAIKNISINITAASQALLNGSSKSPIGSVDRLVERQTLKDVYFIEDSRIRHRRLRDFVACLKGLSFDSEILNELHGKNPNYFDIKALKEKYLKSVDPMSEQGITRMCDLICTKLSLIFYETILHPSGKVYSNNRTLAIFESIMDIIMFYTLVKESNKLSQMTKLLLLMNCYLLFISKAKNPTKYNAVTHDSMIETFAEPMNPLWILDDLFEFQKKFCQTTDFEKAAMFFPDLLGNLKHLYFIISTITDVPLKSGKWENRLCYKIVRSMLSKLESYFNEMHDNIEPNTIAASITLFVKLTDVAEHLNPRRKVNNHQMTKFLQEYHKLSIKHQYDSIRRDFPIGTILSSDLTEEELRTIEKLLKAENQPIDNILANPKKATDKYLSDCVKALETGRHSVMVNKKHDQAVEQDAHDKLEREKTLEPENIANPLSSLAGASQAITLQLGHKKTVVQQKVKLANATVKEATKIIYNIYDDTIKAHSMLAACDPSLQESDEEKMIKLRQSILSLFFRNEARKQEWWDYICAIKALFNLDMKICIALWEAEIGFRKIPQIGIEKLSILAASNMIGPFTTNPVGLDVSYKLILAGAYDVQALLEQICDQIKELEDEKEQNEYAFANHINKNGTNDSSFFSLPHLNTMRHLSEKGHKMQPIITNESGRSRLDELFKFVQIQIFDRLNNWMEMSMLRVETWIARAAEKERWEPRHIENVGRRDSIFDDEDDKLLTFSPFITDSFSFIYKEIDAFFEHLQCFPSEAMSMSQTFYQMLFDLIDLIFCVPRMSMGDCQNLDNEFNINDETLQLAAKQGVELLQLKTPNFELRESVRANVAPNSLLASGSPRLGHVPIVKQMSTFNLEDHHGNDSDTGYISEDGKNAKHSKLQSRKDTGQQSSLLMSTTVENLQAQATRKTPNISPQVQAKYYAQQKKRKPTAEKDSGNPGRQNIFRFFKKNNINRDLDISNMSEYDRNVALHSRNKTVYADRNFGSGRNRGRSYIPDSIQETLATTKMQGKQLLNAFDSEIRDMHFIDDFTVPKLHKFTNLTKLNARNMINLKNIEGIANAANAARKNMYSRTHESKRDDDDDNDDEDSFLKREDYIPYFHRLEPDTFKREIKHICVKFSSVSKACDLIEQLNSYLLGKIGEITPSRNIEINELLTKKFYHFKSKLIENSFTFVKQCKELAAIQLELSAFAMAYQFFKIQNGEKFKIDIYQNGRISGTSVMKLDFVHKIADFLNECTDYLKEDDLRILVVSMSNLYSKLMRQVLISVGNNADTDGDDSKDKDKDKDKDNHKDRKSSRDNRDELMNTSSSDCSYIRVFSYDDFPIVFKDFIESFRLFNDFSLDISMDLYKNNENFDFDRMCERDGMLRKSQELMIQSAMEDGTNQLNTDDLDFKEIVDSDDLKKQKIIKDPKRTKSKKDIFIDNDDKHTDGRYTQRNTNTNSNINSRSISRRNSLRTGDLVIDDDEDGEYMLKHPEIEDRLHPMYRYFKVVYYMSKPSVQLFQKHMLIMSQRNAELKKYEQEEMVHKREKEFKMIDQTVASKKKVEHLMGGDKKGGSKIGGLGMLSIPTSPTHNSKRPQSGKTLKASNGGINSGPIRAVMKTSWLSQIFAPGSNKMIVKEEIPLYDDKTGKPIKMSKKDIGIDVPSLYDSDGEDKKNGTELEKWMNEHGGITTDFSSLASIATSMRPKPKESRIAKLYNHEILHVLSHRLDEEAHAYVENYVQFRNSNRPLLFDITNMGRVLRVIIHEGQNLPSLDANGLSDPYCKVKLLNIFRDLSYYDTKTNAQIKECLTLSESFQKTNIIAGNDENAAKHNKATKKYRSRLMKAKTNVVRQSLNPHWCQALQFELTQRVIDNLDFVEIEFGVWDWDQLTTDDFIGKTRLRVNRGSKDKESVWLNLYDQSYNMLGDTFGKIRVSVECENLWQVTETDSNTQSP